TGLFPSNYVNEIVSPPEPQPQSANEPTVLEVVVALYSFEAERAEELSINVGEQLEILAYPEDAPEWCMARATTGETGFVLRNHVQSVNVAQPPPSPAAGGTMVGEAWYFGRMPRGDADRAG
ncbi:hypothetical protein PENTCL1PPCAC_20519, partial [Pristionchus entomophagus]